METLPDPNTMESKKKKKQKTKKTKHEMISPLYVLSEYSTLGHESSAFKQKIALSEMCLSDI